MHSCCSIDVECVPSPGEQARNIFNSHIVLLDDFMLPNQGYSKQQLISSNFIDFSTFRACMPLFWLPPPTQGCHHPHIRLAHPPPTSWPCAITTPLPHHPGQLQHQLLCTHTCVFWAAPSTWATNAQPAPWSLTTLSQSISIDNSCIHGWEAIKNPFCLGCSTPFRSFCRFLLALCPPTAEELLKTLLLGAHATHTACPPHSNLSC